MPGTLGAMAAVLRGHVSGAARMATEYRGHGTRIFEAEV